MKKILLITIVSLMMVGCGKKEVINDNESIVGGVTTNTEAKATNIDSAALKVFDSATKDYKEMKLEPISLLATQVVSGMNYMFLAVGTKDSNREWKVVTIYSNLEGESSIKNIVDFNVEDYFGKDISLKNDELVGGWNVNFEMTPAELDENASTAFNKAIEGFVGASYTPIAVVGTQVVAGVNYAVLAVGSSVTPTANHSISVLTIYADLEGNATITNVANVDLTTFNN